MKTTIEVNGKPVEIELTKEQVAAIKKTSFNYKDIKTFQDALDFKGETLEQFNWRTERDSPGEKSGKALEVWAYAIRGGKALTKEDYWYYPWFNRTSSPSGLAYYVFSFGGTDADVGSRLCVCDADQTKHFAEVAIDDWSTYIYYNN